MVIKFKYKKIKWPLSQKLFLIIILFFVFISFTFTKGFGSLGTLSLILTSFVFGDFLINSDKKELNIFIYKTLFIVYGIQLIFIIIEKYF